MKQVNRDMGGFMAHHFTKQLGILGFKQRRMNPNPTRRGLTTPKRTPQPSPGFNLNSANEPPDAPNGGPFP